VLKGGTGVCTGYLISEQFDNSVPAHPDSSARLLGGVRLAAIVIGEWCWRRRRRLMQ
jgi:hypothetical protein